MSLQVSSFVAQALASHSPYLGACTCKTIVLARRISGSDVCNAALPLTSSIRMTVALGFGFDAVLAGVCPGINVVRHLSPLNRTEQRKFNISKL
jgi:hypothetical protein